MEGDADAVAVAGGVLAVGEAPHVVDAQHGEDVVEAHAHLDVGFACQGLAGGVGGEEENAAQGRGGAHHLPLRGVLFAQ